MCPDPRGTPLLSTALDPVIAEDYSDEFDQSLCGTARKIFWYYVPSFVSSAVAGMKKSFGDTTDGNWNAHT